VVSSVNKEVILRRDDAAERDELIFDGAEYSRSLDWIGLILLSRAIENMDVFFPIAVLCEYFVSQPKIFGVSVPAIAVDQNGVFPGCTSDFAG
jgi:hypothetical protein